MPASEINTDDFIRLWNQFQSVAEMARHLGLSERALHARRNRIEGKRGIVLGLPAHNAKTKPESAKVILSSRHTVNKLKLKDGVLIVGSDAHYSPSGAPVAHEALLAVTADLGAAVKAVVLNGDLVDGGSISRHPRIRWNKAPTVKQELEAVQARLTEIEKASPPGTRFMRTYGNHCARFENRLSAVAPEFEGIKGFLLADHLPGWDHSERIDVNGDLVIIHDWHSGVHSGWNDVLKGGCHVVTGHTHELSAKAHKGFKGVHYGIKTGMLADEEQDEFAYKLSKPGFNWQAGFAVLTFVDGMLLYPEFCAVRDDGHAYFRGKRYA